MNEQALLDSVKTKYVTSNRINTLQTTDENGMSVYSTNVLVTEDDRGLCQNVIYYVVDKGKVTEKAYYYDPNVQFDPAKIGV